MLTNFSRTHRDLLRTRREHFPRFYFVSDSNLLTLVSSSNNPSKTITHIKNIFSGIESVQLDRESSVGESRPNALSFTSFSGEIVPFVQVIDSRQKVRLDILRCDCRS